MLFRETVAVYCENHTEHTDTLCGQNAGLWHDKACGTDSDPWLLIFTNTPITYFMHLGLPTWRVPEKERFVRRGEQRRRSN
jgi:hypothetical protein